MWIVNVFDLIVVWDFDGDDVVDEYICVYMGFGNFEYLFYGFNFGLDGKFYMFKGNLCGYNMLN